MAKDMGGSEVGVMQANGSGGVLGRGNMDAKSTVGNSGLKKPLTTRTSDSRDMGTANLPISVTREPAAAKPGRGGHDQSKMGG